MKISVFEYEEDPNHGPSSPHREKPIGEYTLEIASTNNKNDSIAMLTKSIISYTFRRQDNKDIFRSPLKLLKKLFLPLGYPHSVSETYLSYQLYDGLQGLCSYWRGVVSAKAVFEAAGVGNAEATALSAALSWALRDGTGMIGGLAYSYVASSYFDSHAKEFRLLLADVINDIALTLDMVAPYFGKDGSIWILGLSTIGKTICGITAGATKGHITQHFAKDGGNVADLTAKESTQETLVSLLGMMGGVWVAKILDRYGHSDPFFWTWLLFGILTAIHVWANYKAVSLLKLTTFNPERTRALFRESIGVMANQAERDQLMNMKKTDTSDTNKMSTIKSPELLKSISKLQSPDLIRESLLSSILDVVFPKIFVSTSPNWNRLQDCSLFWARFENDGEKALPYVIGHDIRADIYVWLIVGASIEDELQAYVHALLLQKILSNKNQASESNKEYFHLGLLQRTRKQVVQLFEENVVDSGATRNRGIDAPTHEKIFLMERLNRLGWDLRGRLHLGFSSRRLQTYVKED